MSGLRGLHRANCVRFMKKMPEGSVDLTVTSPPYDSLRNYNGYEFRFEDIANGLLRVTADGGVVVWVVGDRISGGRSLTSFRQGLFFQDIGFRMHDLIIYQKKNTPFMRKNSYTNCYELMFVLSKGNPKTFNPLKDKTVRNGYEMERLLAAGAEVNATDNKSGATALIQAVAGEAYPAVECLLNAGAAVNVKNKEDGWTALFVAAGFKDPKILERLLKAGAELNGQDIDGETTALMAAAGQGNTAAVERLLEAGADAAIKDISGQTALQRAEEAGHEAVVKAFQRAAAAAVAVSAETVDVVPADPGMGV